MAAKELETWQQMATSKAMSRLNVPGHGSSHGVFTVFPWFSLREVQTLGHFGLFLLALDMKEAAVH